MPIALCGRLVQLPQRLAGLIVAAAQAGLYGARSPLWARPLAYGVHTAWMNVREKPFG